MQNKGITLTRFECPSCFNCLALKSTTSEPDIFCTTERLDKHKNLEIILKYNDFTTDKNHRQFTRLLAVSQLTGGIRWSPTIGCLTHQNGQNILSSKYYWTVHVQYVQ